MALNLTEAEADRVARVNPDPYPTYYAAGSGEVDVSQDFLAVLVLMSQPKKQDAINWLLSLRTPIGVDMTRAGLYAAAVAAEKADAEAVHLQLAALLAPMDLFLEGFPGDQRFKNVPEVGMIAEDATLSLAVHVEQRDAAEYASRICDVLLAQFADPTAVVTDERKRQAMSWIVPLAMPLSVG